MSKRHLVITAVESGMSQSEVARCYGVSQGWVSRLMARYRVEGQAVYEPGSRAPKTSPGAIAEQAVHLILEVRKKLQEQGLDAGADTIGWHLRHHHQVSVSRASIHRILTRHGLVAPAPAKRPKSSYTRFQAEQPNETWQSDFTHYRLTCRDGTPGADVEIITWLDDHSRYALHVSAHRRITGPIVAGTFTTTTTQHGNPASVLTDNGMVYTTRFAGGRSRGNTQRNQLEHLLRNRHIVQKNSRPNHPTTCGKVERFQQTMKNWLQAQPNQPTTINQLQTLLDTFVQTYNQHRPHRSLPHRATPATTYTNRPKATPTTDRHHDTHDRVRTDKIDTDGKVTLRVHGKLHHIGVGRTHARTPVRLLAHDLHIRIINAATGELLRELTLDPTKDYQPTGQPPGPKHKQPEPPK